MWKRDTFSAASTLSDFLRLVDLGENFSPPQQIPSLNKSKKNFYKYKSVKNEFL